MTSISAVWFPFNNFVLFSSAKIFPFASITSFGKYIRVRSSNLEVSLPAFILLTVRSIKSTSLSSSLTWIRVDGSERNYPRQDC